MNAYETILAIETTSTALFNLYAIQNLQRRRSFSRNFHSSYYYCLRCKTQTLFSLGFFIIIIIIIPVSNKFPHASPPRALK